MQRLSVWHAGRAKFKSVKTVFKAITWPVTWRIFTLFPKTAEKWSFRKWSFHARLHVLTNLSKYVRIFIYLDSQSPHNIHFHTSAMMSSTEASCFQRVVCKYCFVYMSGQDYNTKLSLQHFSIYFGVYCLIRKMCPYRI